MLYKSNQAIETEVISASGATFSIQRALLKQEKEVKGSAAGAVICCSVLYAESSISSPVAVCHSVFWERIHTLCY